MDKDELAIVEEGKVCASVRAAAKHVTGGNCTFVDDDLRLLEHLALRAVKAGLVDELHPDVARAALTSIGGQNG